MNAWWNLAQELPSALLLILAAVPVCLAILLVRWRRRRGRAPSWRRGVVGAEPSPAFERGFDLLLDARWQEAAAVLKEAINSDPNRMLEYLELGKLVRRQGEPGRAARLFEQLMARPGLDRAVRLMAQYELALAYRALGWDEPAAAALEQVLGADPAQAEARRELRRLHEEMGHWETAAALEMLRLQRGEAQDRRTLAALLTQQGKVAWAAGDLHTATAHLRAALALDPDGTEATLYLGRLLLRQGKLPKAFQAWDRLATRRPDFLFLAFRDIQEAFRQLNDEAGWEHFLRTFTERHPGDPTGYLALAEWYEARGQIEAAGHCLQQVLDLDPSCREAHLALLALYRLQGLPREALESYERLAKGAPPPPGGGFRCRACGHARVEPFWRCPGCHRWATPERLIPPPSALPMMAGEIAPPSGPWPRRASTPMAVT